MKKVLLSLAIVFGMVGVAAATDYGFSRSRVVYERAPVVVEERIQYPIRERVIEFKEVPYLQMRQFVVDDYNRDKIIERIEIRKPIVEKQIIRIERQQVNKIVVEKNVRSGFFRRILGR